MNIEEEINELKLWLEENKLAYHDHTIFCSLKECEYWSPSEYKSGICNAILRCICGYCCPHIATQRWKMPSEEYIIQLRRAKTMAEKYIEEYSNG